MKDKLKGKSNQNNPGYQPGWQYNPPPVRVRIPEIKVPEIKIPAINIPADTLVPVANVINVLVQRLDMMAQQQAAIVSAVQQLASREVKVDVKTPNVTVKPAVRPNSYYVELDKDGDETVGMRITPQRKSSH